MKVCIVGCGAIGGHLAVKMAQAGAQVSAVVRGATLDAITTRGLTLRNSLGQRWTERIAVAQDPVRLGPQDAVVVAVKTTALRDIAPLLPALLGPGTAVVFMVNGIPWWLLSRLGGDGTAWSAPVAATIRALSDVVAPARIVGGIASSANQVVEPGVVMNTMPSGSFTFGEPDGQLSERVQQLAALVDHSGGKGVASATVVDDIWRKLYTNVVSGPLGSLTGATTADLVDDAELAPLTAQIGREMRAVASASGSRNPASAYTFLRGSGSHKSSMLQDFEALRKPELDSLLGALVDLARVRGVEVPTLEVVLSIVRKRARVLGIYP